jgi:hypothetical protein
MNYFKLSPVFISFLLLGAHFFRAGIIVLVVICLLVPFLLLLKRKWSVITIQILLIIGSIEWLRTLFILAHEHMEIGLPWIRLVVILGAVALFTACSALVFRFRSLRNHFNN